jgi:hypothetical protein
MVQPWLEGAAADVWFKTPWFGESLARAFWSRSEREEGHG